MNSTPVAIGHTIKTERKRQHLSLDDLARRSDVSKGMLSQVESGKTNPTVALLYRIAGGLQVDITRLLPKDKNVPRVWRVIRANDENYVFSQNKDCILRTLSPLDLEKQIEVYELTLKPGAKLVSDPHFAGAEEILAISKGHVRVKSGERETEVSRGDSVYYAADLQHSITNLGKTDAVAHMIVRWSKGS